MQPRSPRGPRAARAGSRAAREPRRPRFTGTRAAAGQGFDLLDVRGRAGCAKPGFLEVGRRCDRDGHARPARQLDLAAPRRALEHARGARPALERRRNRPRFGAGNHEIDRRHGLGAAPQRTGQLRSVDAGSRAQVDDERLGFSQRLVQQQGALRHPEGPDRLEQPFLGQRPEAANLPNPALLAGLAPLLDRADPERLVQRCDASGAEPGNPPEIEDARRQLATKPFEQRALAAAQDRGDLPCEPRSDTASLLQPALAQERIEVLTQAFDRDRAAFVGLCAEAAVALRLEQEGNFPQRAGDGKTIGWTAVHGARRATRVPRRPGLTSCAAPRSGTAAKNGRGRCVDSSERWRLRRPG